MFATSPAESVHALDHSALADPKVTFYSCREGPVLLGCGALARLGGDEGEIKSMRTAAHARGRGVASGILQVILDEARARGFSRVSLETGTQEYFAAARRLYRRHGFVECGPFGAYVLDPNSAFFSLDLTGE